MIRHRISPCTCDPRPIWRGPFVLPAARRRALLEAFGAAPPEGSADAYPLVLIGNDQTTQMLAPPAYQPDRVITLAYPALSTDDSTSKAAWLLDQVRMGGCGCWITNTVQDAQRIFVFARLGW